MIFVKGPSSDSPEDALLVQFQGMIAEYERAQIIERTRRGKTHRARQGTVNVLSGAGKGVLGIKLGRNDVCLGGALSGNRFDALVVETTGGIRKEVRRGAYPATHRGGKGYEIVKRADLVRAVPPPIELVNWDEVEGKSAKKDAEKGGNGSLFE